MKHLLLLFLALTALTFSACEDDDDPLATTGELNYAGANVTAPTLPQGTNTFAAYFPSNITSDFTGRNLETVDFFMFEVPDRTIVRIHDDSNGDREPGNQLYSIDLTQRVNNRGEVSHRLPTPLEITGEGLWLVVEVETAQSGDRAVGCDAGQNYSPNGDLILFSTNNEFDSFQTLSGGERVNWNISATISAE